jgi:hypothetical protein
MLFPVLNFSSNKKCYQQLTPARIPFLILLEPTAAGFSPTSGSPKSQPPTQLPQFPPLFSLTSVEVKRRFSYVSSLAPPLLFNVASPHFPLSSLVIFFCSRTDKKNWPRTSTPAQSSRHLAHPCRRLMTSPSIFLFYFLLHDIANSSFHFLFIFFLKLLLLPFLKMGIFLSIFSEYFIMDMVLSMALAPGQYINIKNCITNSSEHAQLVVNRMSRVPESTSSACGHRPRMSLICGDIFCPIYKLPGYT